MITGASPVFESRVNDSMAVAMQQSVNVRAFCSRSIAPQRVVRARPTHMRQASLFTAPVAAVGATPPHATCMQRIRSPYGLPSHLLCSRCISKQACMAWNHTTLPACPMAQQQPLSNYLLFCRDMLPIQPSACGPEAPYKTPSCSPASWSCSSSVASCARASLAWACQRLQ